MPITIVIFIIFISINIRRTPSFPQLYQKIRVESFCEYARTINIEGI